MKSELLSIESNNNNKIILDYNKELEKIVLDMSELNKLFENAETLIINQGIRQVNNVSVAAVGVDEKIKTSLDPLTASYNHRRWCDIL